MDDDDDDRLSVCLCVRQRGARVGRFGTSRSFVRRGTERAGRVFVFVGEDVVVVSSSLVFKSFLRCGDERTNER